MRLYVRTLRDTKCGPGMVVRGTSRTDALHGSHSLRERYPGGGGLKGENVIPPYGPVP